MSVALPYFYPRPPRGGRRAVHLFLKLFCIFLSTPSARRATYQPGERRNARGFLSTPSARRATHPRFCCSGESGISIHALREEGDVCGSPYAGHHKGFLSTPSARRATSQASNKSHRPKPFLSTPSARRATFFRCTSCWIDTISIHALREEGDILRGIGQWRNSDFYPRPPRGGRLLFRCHLQRLFCISIHALREEGDRKRHRAVGTDTNFYPRPPRGGRQDAISRLLT